MDIEKAREYVTHRLNRELGEQELAELQAFIAEHPDFQEEIKAMEGVWERLGVLKPEAATTPPMRQDVRRRLERRPLLFSRENLPRLAWVAAAAAAAVLFLASAVHFIPPETHDEILPPIERNQQPEPGVAKPSGPAAADGFAGVEFPEAREAGAAPGEKPGAEVAKRSPNARLLRARGLVLAKGPDDRRWSVLRRGDELAPDTELRIPATPDFGALFLEDDGSSVTVRAGSAVRFLEARHWAMTGGAAWFDVAGTEKAGFVVQTPQGTVSALGTAFGLALSRQTAAPARPLTTVCEVEKGKVELAAKAAAGQTAPKLLLESGKSGLIDSDGAREVEATPGSKDWLAKMQVLAETDESIARLVAEAEEAGKQLPLELKSYDVDVTVIDGVARTFLDMVFINHTDRRLEGTFYYAVPAEATISEFAMYVGQQRIVGEVLEQQRARQIYEYIRREQRDPALLEWAGGNLFKMRVFPIEPKSEKRVQLGYTEILRRIDGQMNYTFPLTSEMLKKTPLRDFSLKLKVLSSPGIIDLHSPTHQVRQGLSKDKTRGALAFQARDYAPDRDFKATWNVPESGEFILLTNRRPDEPEAYFMAQVAPNVRAVERPSPERLIVVVDGSASVDPQSFNVGREFAGSLVEMVSGWQYNVLLAGQDVVPMHPDYRIAESSEYDRVKDFLSQRAPIGGTDLLAVFRWVAEIVPADGSTCIVYVGDGIDTLGRLEDAALVDAIARLFGGREVELSCVSIGASYDQLVLSGLAERLGGTFQPVTGVHDVFDAADGILGGFFCPVRRDVELGFEGVEVAALYPPRLGTLSMGDTGLVLGRIVKPGDGKAVVTGTADGKPFRREYPVSVSPPEDQNQFLPRLWAKAHIDALRAQMGLGTPKHDAYLKDQIIATSLRYQIMSPFTAFLVLESEEDYERFGVVRRMRMVDWKGELEGVSHAAPAVAKPKPRARAPSRLDWRMVLLPEPSLNLTPTSSVQEVMESLKLLPESVKEAAQTSLSTALRGIGIIGGTAGGGGGGGEDLNGGELEGDERWAKFARGSLTAPIFDRIAEENDSGQLITETEAQTDWTGSVHGRAKQSSAEDADFSDFLGEEGEKAEVRITRGGDLKKAGELAFDGEGGGGDFLDYSVEPPGTPLSGPMPADGLFDGTELDEIDAHFLGSGERLVIPSPYESRLHRWSPRRIASYQYSEGQWLGSYLHRYAVTEIEAGNGEKLRIDPAWRDQGYLRRMAMAARSGSPFPHPRPPGADEGYLRRAVMGRPESSQARLDLFLVLLRSGKCKAALKELDTLLQAVNSPHLWLERAWVLNQAGDKDGAYESVQKAGSLVGPAPDPQPGALQERVAQELATLGRHAEVARLFEALADAAKSENPSARWYSRAFSSAQSAGEKNPEALWERATKKWPQSASVHSQAARSLESLNPELAAKYADKARELGGDTFRLRISILFNQKKADEAWKMLEQAFQAAQNGSEAHVRLYDCQQRDRRRAMQWAEQALEKGAGPQMEGAVQAVNSYDISPRARERVLELALQDNFPANLRITAFHIAHHQGHRNEKWAEILFPLFRNTETAEGRQQALSALQQLANYGYYRLAAPYLESLSALKLENESSQVQLAQARYQIEWNTGNRNEAVDHLEAAFRVCKDENHAYNLANTLIYPLIEQGEAERAVRVVTDMFTRFPAYPNNRYLYQNLAQNLRSRGQLGLLADFRRKVAEAEGTAKTKALLDERRLILEGLKDKKYGEVAGQLRGFEQTLGKEEQELAAAIRGAVAELKELAEKRAAAKPETAPAAGQPAPKPPEPDAAELELRKALDDRLLEFDTLTGLLRNVKALQVRIAALDATVRASFLAECAERAKSEDPVWREWTQARLACLRLSGQPEAYVQALEALNQSEPQDPLWPRLLANAYTTGGETEKARDLLDKLCQADPEEVSYALSRHGLVEASGDREAVEAARNDLWQALRPKPSLLYQLAQDWQRQGKTDLAVDAYMALMEMPGYQDNPWYLLQAGNILQGSGQREQAIRTYLRVFEKAGWASNQGYSAVESLRNLMNDEALLLIVEKEVPKLLESKETPIRAYGLLLAYHTAKLRNKAQDARNHLDALRQVSFKEAPNLAQPVVALLATEREYDWLTEYLRSAAAELKDYALQNVLQSAASALQSFLKDNPKALEATMEIVRLARSPDSGMNPSAQNQLLSNLASWLGQQKETRDKAIAIYRELLRTGDPNATYQAYQVVNWLIDDGKFSEALEEVRRFPLGQNDWNGWNAYDRATRHIGYDKHDWGLAMRVAQECWKRLEGDLQGYGGSAFDRFIEMGWQALENKSLPQDLRDTLTQEVLAYGKACFDGDPGRTGLRGGHLAHCIRDLGLAEQFRKMAEEAGQSDNPQRVLNAAQFTLQTASNLWDRKDNFDLAVKSFRRLLQMEGASRDQKVWACSSLYTLYTNYKDKEWDNAIEVLETWKDAGGLDRRSYLLNRTCCLYGLKRTEDARKAVRELLQMPDYRRNYWSAENLARYCREGADYAMEVECWEHAIRWMRLSRQIRPEYVSQFYVALAGAYRNLGEKERSYETFLRGMSLLNRNTQTHYYQQLMNSLMEFLKQEVQGGLEAMVAHYEKNMRQKGEMPHLRITFGAAYRQEGNERKALQQFEIAARLMPQDTALRKEVVDGYQRLGENGLAEAALLAWAQLDPQNIDLYKSLGGLYDKMSVPDKALRAFATMAEVRPREAEGHRAYGQELVARKMPEQAVIAYEKAVRYRPTEFAIADELASLCRQTEGQTPEQRNARIEGLWTGGESACRQAMEDLPDDPLPWLNLARFLNAQGRKSEAKDLVSEILARQWPRFARETREEAGQILGTLR